MKIKTKILTFILPPLFFPMVDLRSLCSLVAAYVSDINPPATRRGSG
jgi:hypothetical protein